jgi:hypothetical protein
MVPRETSENSGFPKIEVNTDVAASHEVDAPNSTENFTIFRNLEWPIP